MKYLFVLLALVLALYADKINKKTLACPDIDKLKKAGDILKSIEIYEPPRIINILNVNY